jgi:hypothetical protein
MSINDKPTADVTQGNDDTVDEVQVDELSLLKQRATLLGITYSNNIGLDALRKKVQAAQEGTTEEPEVSPEPEQPNPLEQAVGITEKPMTLRQQIRMEQLKLVRVRIQNLDPKKKDLPGEVITVANEYMGTVKKYVPFGEATDEGYHIPYCIYTFLKDRKFQNISVRKGKNGQPAIGQTMVREFSIEILPPLTREELQNLAQAQIAAGSVGSE